MTYSTKTKFYKIESRKKALELIHNYYSNSNQLIKYIEEYGDMIKGANISQYGIEATLSKSNEVNTTPFLYEIERRMKKDRMCEKLGLKLRPVQMAKQFMNDETEELVLELRMDGKSLKRIHEITGINKRDQYKIFDKIADDIVKYN
ncbi:hypothetical protein [Mammaliicoccus sciuri]|uniref:hypothetical protein n=1 Tax=Mammaliicoccus sciuri TaxID=1296 RepID=UPI003F567A59